MLRQCATTAITAVHAASIMFAMAAMLGRLVAQLKMPRLDAYLKRAGLVIRGSVGSLVRGAGVRCFRVREFTRATTRDRFLSSARQNCCPEHVAAGERVFGAA